MKEAEKTRENAKAIEELQAKAGIQKTGGKAKGKHKDKDKRSAPKANGPRMNTVIISVAIVVTHTKVYVASR